jgi:DNA ligase-1
MDYKKLAELYENLEKTSKRLEKTYILANFLKNCPKNDLKDVVYLVQGRIFPAWDERTMGVSSKLVIRAIAKSSGESIDKVENMFGKLGDLGLVAANLLTNKKQKTLFSETLTLKIVIDTIRGLCEMEGQGTMDKKVSMVAKLLSSASTLEAKFITRTVLEDLRAGIAQGTLRDALISAFLPDVLGVFYECECGVINPNVKKCLSCGKDVSNKFKNINTKSNKILKVSKVEDLKNLGKYDIIYPVNEIVARDVYNYFVSLVQNAYDMSTDFGKVALDLLEKGVDGVKGAQLKVGRPIKVMLYQKAKDIDDAFNIVGKPAVVERKFDGFRLQIHGDKDDIALYTRRLDNVTRQFPDVVEYVKKHVKSNNFILDSEVLGLDPKTKRILPFQVISQRIKRKHDIHKMVKYVPVKVVVFDVMQINGENLLNQPLKYRNKKLKCIIKGKKNELEIVEQFITSSEKQIEKIYKMSLDEGHEGIMIKNLEGIYKPGSRVGYGVKLKPVMESLDLVIVGAEWGEGKRANWFSSFTLACRSKDQFLEIGKVGTGIKEKPEEGVSFVELTEALKPLIIEEKNKNIKVKPKIIVEVNYEEIQKSSNYSSGYALRFPRVVRLRSMEKGLQDISNLGDVKRLYEIQK